MPESDRCTRLRRILPYSAVAGLVLVAFALAIGAGKRQALLVDTGETRPVVEATVARLQALHPASVEEPVFLEAVRQTADARYIATVWVFAPDGRIVYSSGSTRSTGTAADRATADTRRILAGLPADALDDERTLYLLAASAIQAEGEHNDVYRHIVRPLMATDGRFTGLIGVAYDVSPGVSAAPDAASMALLGIPLGMFLYWMSLPAWVLLDARRRGERSWAWAAFVLVGNVAGLLAYILARAPAVPPRAAAAPPSG